MDVFVAISFVLQVFVPGPGYIGKAPHMPDPWMTGKILPAPNREFKQPGRQRQPDRHLKFRKASIVSVSYL